MEMTAPSEERVYSDFLMDFHSLDRLRLYRLRAMLLNRQKLVCSLVFL